MKIHFSQRCMFSFFNTCKIETIAFLQPHYNRTKFPPKNPMKYERSHVAQSYVSIRSGCVLIMGHNSVFYFRK